MRNERVEQRERNEYEKRCHYGRARKREREGGLSCQSNRAIEI